MLREAGLTFRMVGTAFLREHIAPLHHHVERLWNLRADGCKARLRTRDLSDDELKGLMQALFGADEKNLPEAIPALYDLEHSDLLDIVRSMLKCDEWGVAPPD